MLCAAVSEVGFSGKDVCKEEGRRKKGRKC